MKLSFTYAWSRSTSTLEVIYTLMTFATIEGANVMFVGSTGGASVTLTRRSTYESTCIVTPNASKPRNATTDELPTFSFADLEIVTLATS